MCSDSLFCLEEAAFLLLVLLLKLLRVVQTLAIGHVLVGELAHCNVLLSVLLQAPHEGNGLVVTAVLVAQLVFVERHSAGIDNIAVLIKLGLVVTIASECTECSSCQRTSCLIFDGCFIIIFFVSGNVIRS